MKKEWLTFYKWFKRFIVLCYFLMGAYILFLDNYFDQFPALIKYTIGSIFIAYGVFRFFRLKKEQ